MKCDEIKLLIIEALYDEISAQDEVKLKEHLLTCSSCQAEISALKSTSQVLGQWHDSEPKTSFVFASETFSWFKKIAGRFSGPKLIYVFSIAAATILVVLALTNSQIKYQDGNWELQMSLFNRPPAPSQAYVSRDELLHLQDVNIKLIEQLLEANHLQQQQELKRILTQFAIDIEQKRQIDMQLVSRSLDQVHYGAKARLDRTDQMLNNLIRLSSYQTKER